MHVRLLMLVSAALLAGARDGSAPHLVRFLNDYLRLKSTSSLVLFLGNNSDRFSLLDNINVIYGHQQTRDAYFAICQDSSMSRVADILRTSSPDTQHVILSSDNSTLEFLEKVNASGFLDGKYRWLVLSDDGRLAKRWRSRYLPVNNQVTIGQVCRRPDGVTQVDLTEMYHLADGLPVQTVRLGRWSSADGITNWDDRTIFERRQHWRGLTLRVATIEGPPLTTWVSRPVPGVGGYFGDIWKMLADVLQFNYTVQRSVDGEFGALRPDGHWTGVVGMLTRREVDVAVSHLSVIESRSRVIDFTSGLYVLRYRMLLKKHSSQDLSWTTYLNSFDGQLWAMLIVTIVLGSAAISLMYQVERRCLQVRKHHGNFGFLDSLKYFYGAACQQGADAVPHGLGTRFFFWVFFVMMVTVSTAYSAMLVSFLAVQNLDMPFTDLQGMLKEGTYKLGVVGGTSQYDYFKLSKLDIQKRVYEKHVVQLESHSEGMRRIRTERLAYFSSYSGKIPCDIVATEQSYYHGDAALGLQKHSPYREFFNYHLARLTEGGIMDHSFCRELASTDECELQRMQGLGMQNVVSAFALLACGIGASLVALAAELAWSRFACWRKGQHYKAREERCGALNKLQGHGK